MESQPQHKLSCAFCQPCGLGVGCYRRGQLPPAGLLGGHMLRGQVAHTEQWRKRFAPSVSPTGKSHACHLHCAFLHDVHQDQRPNLRQEFSRTGVSLQDDCDFGPARSSQPYLSLLSELLPKVSMGCKSHRPHINILKAAVGLWSWYLQLLRLWRRSSSHLYIEAAIKNHFQFATKIHMDTHIHTQRVSSTLNPPSAPLYHPKRMKITGTGQDKGVLSPQLSSW